MVRQARGVLRKDGDKKLVEQVLAERKGFDATGELPKGAPAAIPQKSELARKALEAAYTQAVKDYIKAKKDDEAVAVEAAWKEFKDAGKIDLLALVDAKAHAFAGEWKKVEKVLVGVSGGNGAYLQLPYEPGEEYDLELTCRRLQGDDCFGLGLVAGGHTVMIFIDAYPANGYETGFKIVDKKQISTFKGQLIKSDKDTTVACSIRPGKIDLRVDGKAITSFKGDFKRLSYPDRIPNPKALWLGTSVDRSARTKSTISR